MLNRITGRSIFSVSILVCGGLLSSACTHYQSNLSSSPSQNSSAPGSSDTGGGVSISLSFGQVCPASSTCNYTDAAEGNEINVGCAAGFVTVQSSAYAYNTKSNSCLNYVSSHCWGSTIICDFTFSNTNCGGDPSPGNPKTGSAVIVCADSPGPSPSPSPSPTFTPTPTPVPVAPQNRPVSAFGYGAVQQFLATANNSLTGSAICQNQAGAHWNCLSVSGSGTSCSATVPAGQLVSCYQLSQNPVNEANFQPINCQGNGTGAGNWTPLLTSADWCAIVNYMPTRLANTLYQYDDYVRLGVNTLYGGTIFELYGADKIDRIMQNGGGANQLSIWGGGTDPQGAWFLVSGNSTSCNPTAYPTEAACAAANPHPNCNVSNMQSPGSNPSDCCQWSSNGANVSNCTTDFGCSGNGWSAGGPFNPIQAQSAGCNYGQPSAQVDSVSSPASNTITVVKSGPANFTKTSTVAGLTWTQTSGVYGPYAKVTYTLNYAGSIVMSEADQEIPAIFSHGAIGTSIYYYSGSKPYNDAAGEVSSMTSVPPGTNINFMLPGATMSASNAVYMSENWVSICDPTGIQCLTVASFTPLGQLFAYGFGNTSQTDLTQDNTYLGLHGHFAILPGMSYTDTVYYFPYRFDDVIQGSTVRQWIYALQKGAAGP